MKNFIRSILVASLLGCLALAINPNIRQAFAATSVAVFDTINRAYFVAVGTQNMTIGTTGTGTFNLVAAGTPVAQIDKGGVKPIGYSPIVISTPVAGVNEYLPGFNVIPPTATANTAAFIGVATPIARSSFTIYNSSAASVYAKAAGGATINGATAGGRILLAAKCTLTCTYASATDLQCNAPVCATAVAA